MPANVQVRGISRRGRPVQGDDRALVHEGDAVAEPFGLVQVVGGQDGGHAGAPAPPADQVEQLVADASVQADRRLVEEQPADGLDAARDA